MRHQVIDFLITSEDLKATLIAAALLVAGGLYLRALGEFVVGLA